MERVYIFDIRRLDLYIPVSFIRLSGVQPIYYMLTFFEQQPIRRSFNVEYPVRQSWASEANRRCRWSNSAQVCKLNLNIC